MSQTNTTTYTSNASYSIKEDLSNIVKNIAPVDCPFSTAVKTGKATSTSHLWNKDTLGSVTITGTVEGADASGSAITMPTQLSSVTQIISRDFKLTGTMQAVDSAAKATQYKYQLGRHLKMLKRDKEASMLGATYSAGSSTTARVMRSVIGWIDGSTYTDSDCLYDFGSAYATTNALTEDRFVTQCQYAWDNGGMLSDVFCSPGVKRTIDGFNGSNRQTVNVDAASKKLTNVVDIYESSFGLVKVHPDRFFPANTSGSDNYDYCAVLDMDLWREDVLRPVKVTPMAVTGDAQGWQVLTETCLAALEPNGNTMIANIYRET